MAIAVDHRNNGTQALGATTLSWSHTVTGGLSSSILFAFGQTGNGTAKVLTAAVWDDGGANTAMGNSANGVTMEKVGNDGSVYSDIWFLQSPASGTKTIKLTCGSASGEFSGGSASYSGVDQTTGFVRSSGPVTAGYAAGANPTTTLASSSTDLVIDSCAINEAGTQTAVPAGSQTQIWQENNGANFSAGFGSDLVGSSSSTITWTGLTGGNGGSQVVISIIAALPVINSQPANQTVWEGQTASFSVTATSSGGPLSYQWFCNGGSIGGATSSSYTTPALTYTTNNNDTYYCAVTDSNGTVNSNTALLTVLMVGTPCWIKA